MSEQLDFITPPSVQPKEAPAAAVPAMVEYQVGGEAWLCQRLDQLHAEFEVSAAELSLFHGVAAMKTRGWLAVRRLYGLWPMVPPAAYEVDDLRLWGRPELQEALGLTRAQLQAELDAVRGAWMGARQVQAETAAEDTPKPQGYYFSDEAILRDHGLAQRFESQAEAAWFAQRVRDYEKILKEKFAAMLARNALMTELRIHRLDDLLNDPDRSRTGSGEWTKHLKLRNDLDKQYQDQIGQIKELCPWAGAVAGKHSFVGVLTDVTKGIQEYQARGDTRLVDGIFTATEVQVECRRSVQASIRYRAGLVVFLNAAKAGLWDPNWTPPFEPRQLKQMDLAWTAAAIAAGDASGERVPDLERDGPEGEYAELTTTKSVGAGA